MSFEKAISEGWRTRREDEKLADFRGARRWNSSFFANPFCRKLTDDDAGILLCSHGLRILFEE